MLEFNLLCNGYLFAWSGYNEKKMHEKHQPLETVFIISNYTFAVKSFAYCDFKQMFTEIK